MTRMKVHALLSLHNGDLELMGLKPASNSDEDSLQHLKATAGR